MILVDTSVLVDYLRHPSPAVRAVLASPQCRVCGVTRAEILHGARTPQDAEALRSTLDIFTPALIPEELWDNLGAHLASLRTKGLPMPFQDVLIATVAMHHGAELWTRDKHFSTLQQFFPDLALFDGPRV